MRILFVALTLLVVSATVPPASAAVVVRPTTGVISFDIAELLFSDGDVRVDQRTPSRGSISFSPTNPILVTPLILGEPFQATFNVMGFGYSMVSNAHVDVDVSAKSAAHDYGSEHFEFDLSCNTSAISDPVFMTCAGGSASHKFGAFQSVLLGNIINGTPEVIDFSYVVSQTMTCSVKQTLGSDVTSACISGSVTVTDLAGLPDPTWEGILVATPVPEPASALLAGSGLLGLIGIRRRRSR